MNFPSDLPRLPKWIFLAGDAALLAAAWAIAHNAKGPYTGATLWAIVILVIFAVAVGAYPFVADDARKYDQAIDDRQKALQVLAETVGTAAEQISIAAAGLQTIADAAQQNFRKSEALNEQLSDHIADLDRRQGSARPPAGGDEALVDAALKKITRTAAVLEATLAKTVEVARTLPPFSPPVSPPSAPAEVPPVLPAHMVEIKPAARDESVAPIPPPETGAVPAADPGSAAAGSAPQEQLADSVAPAAPPPRKRAPRKTRVTEPPPPPVEAIATAPAPEPELAPPAAVEPPPPAAVDLAPPALPEAAFDTVPPLSFGPEEEELAEELIAEPAEDLAPPTFTAAPPAATGPADVAPDPEPVGESAAETVTEAAPPEAAPAEAARSADGATRLVVTAYIGIGNRLFIRGEGPGLAWDRGVPLTFVSIGKWRWETNDATRPIRFRLFKNDTVECTALGERTVEPGAQQELSAAF